MYTREDFLDVVYTELADDMDNNRASRIIEAADEYVENYVTDTNVGDMPCGVDKVLEDLYKLQKECPELEIILETKNGTVSCKIDDANIYIGINKELVFDAE